MSDAAMNTRATVSELRAQAAELARRAQDDFDHAARLWGLRASAAAVKAEERAADYDTQWVDLILEADALERRQQSTRALFDIANPWGVMA